VFELGNQLCKNFLFNSTPSAKLFPDPSNKAASGETTESTDKGQTQLNKTRRSTAAKTNLSWQEIFKI